MATTRITDQDPKNDPVAADEMVIQDSVTGDDRKVTKQNWQKNQTVEDLTTTGAVDMSGASSVSHKAGSVTAGALVFSGALVYLTSDLSVSNETTTTVPWTAVEYDDGDWYSSGANTRLTVPSGISVVQITAHTRWPSVTTAAMFYMDVLKNGSSGAGQSSGALRGATNIGTPSVDQQIANNQTTAPIKVTSGDYFEVRVRQSTGGSRNLQGGAGGASYFSIVALA